MSGIESLGLLLVLLSQPATAETCEPAAPGAPMRVYLVTMSPGRDLFAKFGHSLLWVSGGPLRRPLTYSWGAYDSSKEEPVSAFLDGRMHYWLDVSTLDAALRRAEKADRTAVAQHLDLPPEAIERLGPLLVEASRPENHVYPYDWREQNCATKIRDLLDTALEGQLAASVNGPTDRTWRGEVLRHLAVQPLAWFGWHFMAAGEADRTVDRWRGMFLPDRLKEGLDEAQIDGRPLVAKTCTLRSGSNGWAPAGPPRGWPWTLPLGTAWAAGISGLPRRAGGALISLLGLAAGALGSATVWLAMTSAIEGVGYNLNWSVASPATLALVPAGLAYALGRGGQASALLSAGLAMIGVLGVLISLSGIQDTTAIWALFLPPLVAAAWVIQKRWRTR